MYLDLVKRGGSYVTLNPPFLRLTDERGVACGALHAAGVLAARASELLASRGVHYRWALFSSGFVQNAVDAVCAGVTPRMPKHVLPLAQVAQAHMLTEGGQGRVVLSME